MKQKTFISKSLLDLHAIFSKLLSYSYTGTILYEIHFVFFSNLHLSFHNVEINNIWLESAHLDGYWWRTIYQLWLRLPGKTSQQLLNLKLIDQYNNARDKSLQCSYIKKAANGSDLFTLKYTMQHLLIFLVSTIHNHITEAEFSFLTGQMVHNWRC